MKNVVVLYEENEIREFVRSKWKTDLFRNAQEEGGIVSHIVDAFCAAPRFTFDASDENLETAHFSSWWGGLQNRAYDNDYIHDLYMLHEMTHIGTMPHVGGLEFQNFQRKMFDNELLASTISEIAIYFDMPELRTLSFRHPIYADRFLGDDYYKTLWTSDPERVFDELKLRRRNVMTSQTPADDMENWIRKFSYQNDVWANLWVHRYDEVETALEKLHRGCHTLGRRAAMDEFMLWLQSPAVTNGTDIPFPEEAAAFASAYWLNKAQYTRSMENQKSPPPKPA